MEILRNSLDEQERQQEVASFDFLKSKENTLFNDITETLTTLFGVEFAFICIIDKDKQRFISEVGLNIPFVPREGSICAQTIRQETPHCIPDIIEDGRFCSCPAVANEPHLRFYAGAPLQTSKGHIIGTIAVAARTPRELAPSELDTLSAMARLVMRQLESLRSTHEKDQETEKLKALLNDVTEVMTEGLAVFDANDTLVFFNKRYKDFYDKTGRNIKLGKKFKDILADGLRAGDYAEAIGREKKWLADRLHRHQHPPDQPFEQHLSTGEWLLVSEKRLPNGGLVGIRTDITALKENEKGIRESEQRFRDFTETASDWIWETDDQQRLMPPTSAHQRMSGIDRVKNSGKTRKEVAAEDTSTQKWKELDAKIAARQVFRDFSYRLLGPDGKKKVISTSGVPVFDESGRFKGYRGTGRNITQQVEANERLQAAEARIRAAFNNTVLGMVLIDSKGIILEFNKEAERMFQYRSDEVVGQNVSLLMPNDHARQHDSYIKRYLETGIQHVIGTPKRMLGRRKDGSLFPVNLGIGKIDLRGGIQFVGSITDLTEQEQLEKQLQRAQKLEAIGQLTGGIAHDFNNILGIVKGNMELGLRKVDADSKVADYFRKATRATERATKITQQLLSFSRQKEFYSENLACDLNSALKDVEALLQGSVAKGVDLHISLHDQPLIAHVDTGDLQDVIINLAVNARDAMRSAGLLRIELSEVIVEDRTCPSLAGLQKGRYGVISVADNGPGIPDEIRARIFEPFFTTKPKGHGTGLGLAMVYGFAKRSRGEIKVYSEPGVGTCFRIYIPLFDDNLSFSNATAETRKKPPRGTEHVLIVDDEPDLATYAQVSLEELGYKALTCSTPLDALKILQSDTEVDLVFTDVVMPGPMNGIDLVRKVQEIKPRIKHLLASGFPDEILSGRDRTNSRLLVKPYDQQTLAWAVRKTLDESVTQ